MAADILSLPASSADLDSVVFSIAYIADAGYLFWWVPAYHGVVISRGWKSKLMM
jgi:hypothetical protein